MLLKNMNITWNMCSFEIHNVNVSQKMKEWWGGLFSKNCNNWYPPLPPFFELHEQNVSQKNTFFMHNSDSLKALIVLP